MPGVQVLTQHNDNARTGANLAESILTPDAVAAPGRFGKLFELPVEGHVYAQPLYVPNVAFPERQRNVIYVATMHNLVYAFDADAPPASGPSGSEAQWSSRGRCPGRVRRAARSPSPATSSSSDPACCSPGERCTWPSPPTATRVPTTDGSSDSTP